VKQQPGSKQEVGSAPIAIGCCEKAQQQAAGGNRLDGRVDEVAQASGPGLGELRVVKDAECQSGFHLLPHQSLAALLSLAANNVDLLDLNQKFLSRSSLARKTLARLLCNG
jgi:hypothetical protein